MTGARVAVAALGLSLALHAGIAAGLRAVHLGPGNLAELLPPLFVDLLTPVLALSPTTTPSREAAPAAAAARAPGPRSSSVTAGRVAESREAPVIARGQADASAQPSQARDASADARGPAARVAREATPEPAPAPFPPPPVPPAAASAPPPSVARGPVARAAPTGAPAAPAPSVEPTSPPTSTASPSRPAAPDIAARAVASALSASNLSTAGTGIGAPDAGGGARSSMDPGGGAVNHAGEGSDGAAREGDGRAGAPGEPHLSARGPVAGAMTKRGAGGGAGWPEGDGAGGDGDGASGLAAIAAEAPGGIPPEYDGYVRALRRRIQERLVYPWLAVRQGLQGTVELEVRLDRAGRLTDVVVGSATTAALRDAAVRAVRDATPFPFPPGLAARPLTIRLPIVFELR